MIVKDELIDNELERAYEAEVANEPESAYELECANEADVANDELMDSDPERA